MSASRAKPEAVFPWTTVSIGQIQSTIESKVRSFEGGTKPKKIAIDALPSIRQVLVDVFQEEELRDEADDVLESYDPEEFLIPFLEREPNWIVRCSVTDNMVSGSWGIRYFVVGTKGYFYYRPDFGVGDDVGESLPIIGVWTPSDDRRQFIICLMVAYWTYWEDLALPPRMGQWANGPADILACVIDSILEEEPDAWSTVLDRLRADLEEDGSLLPDLVREAANIVECNESDAVGILKVVLTDKCDSIRTLKPTKQESRVLVAAFVATIGRGGF